MRFPIVGERITFENSPIPCGNVKLNFRFALKRVAHLETSVIVLFDLGRIT